MSKHSTTQIISALVPFASQTHHNALPLLACQHYFNLAMSSGSIAIGALVLVPIAIAVSAAFIALKCAEASKRIGRYIRRFWDSYYPWSRNNRTRRRRSDLNLNQHYANSWADLESTNTKRGYATFIGQSPRHNSVKSHSKADAKSGDDIPGEIWHPTRSARLMWSFTNPRSPNHRRSGLSSVARPSPIARRAERLSADDAVHLASPTKAWGHRRAETDH